MGSTSHGYIYIYHNTMYNYDPGNGPSMFGSNSRAYNEVYRNNMIDTASCALYYRAEAGNETNDLDSDCWQSDSSTQKFRWGNELGPTGDGKFTNFEDFQAYTGQEQHGIFADPLFTDPDGGNFELLEGSPCRDAGVVLPGFNDENSPWPYQGSAPDIGAYELASGPPPPLGPLHHIIVTPASLTLNTGQTQQFTATGYDQNDNIITGLSFVWSVVDPDAGSVDGNGLFTAGTVEGTYPDVVKAEADSTAGYASVSITVNPPNSAPVAVDDAYSVDENTTLTTAAPGVLVNEIDEDDDITVTSSKYDVSSMRRDAESYVRADMGAGHFSDFEHLVTVHVSSVDSHGAASFWGLSNSSNTYGQQDDNDEGLAGWLWYNEIGVCDFTNDNEDWYVGSPPDTYYCTIKRDGTTLSMKIYSDADRTDLLDTLSITCGTDTYQYVFGVMSRESDADPSDSISFYSENLDLQEGAAVPGVSANDSDVDGDPLTAVLVSSVTNGTLTLNADGSFSYTPAADYNGSDSFTYVANDGTADSNTATVSITVNPTSLDHIVVTPSTADVKASGSQQFTATGYDQYDNEVPITPSWSTDVGSIDESGLFAAQGTAGVSGYVKATVDAIEGQAVVNIVDGYALGDADGDGSVTSLDITKLERIIMGLDDPTAGADASEDGSINTLDITKIELIIMGG